MPIKPLFVGIDPGTTTSYAVLDADGNLLELYSSKNLGINNLIKKISAKGLPIVVGTDKKKIPEFIQTFAVKTGAKVHSPNYDLKELEKRKLTKAYKTKNDHEMDALASVLESFSSYRTLLKKIKVYAEKNNENSNDLIFHVVKEDLSLAEATKLLHPKEEIKPKKIEQSLPNYNKLHERYTNLKEQYSLLKKANKSLSTYLKHAEKKLSDLENFKRKKSKFESKKIDSLFQFKEKRLIDFQSEINKKDTKIESLKEEIENVKNFLAWFSNNYLVKKLNNLGKIEFNDKKSLRITKGDILYVKDPNINNQATLDYINNNISLILCDIKPTKKTTNQIRAFLIPVKNLKIKEWMDFALVDKKLLDKEAHSKDRMQDIIKAYKESRSF